MEPGERLSGLWDELRASFGFFPGLAMVAGIALGFGLPSLDDAFDLEIPVFAFETQDAARSLLSTIATVTVAVAGLAFSVTVVAFTLASSQLSPRVLRSFRRDRTTQATLALLLGTFVYCLVVLVRLGAAETAVPNLSITIAIALAFVSFALFAAFIAHIVSMLQPSSVIAAIQRDGRTALDDRYPRGVAEEPDDPAAARAAAEERMRRGDPVPVRAESDGYLTLVRGDAIVHAASSEDALVRQVPRLGDYVVRGDVLAEVWGGDGDGLADDVREAFELDAQRTVLQDPAFALRQLADVALKGLSPGINDPTTAENAMGAATALLVQAAHARPVSRVRADGDGRPRFVAAAPDLDELVRLGFDQVRVFAAPYPTVSVLLVELLGRIERAARRAGVEQTEATRQADLVRRGADGEVPTAADAERVRTVG